MNICNVKVRLNLEKDEHRSAYEILKKSESSMSQFVIAAVNAYGGYLTEQDQQKLLLERISGTVRSTLCEMLGVSLSGGASLQKSIDLPDDTAEESGEIADDFLQNF